MDKSSNWTHGYSSTTPGSKLLEFNLSHSSSSDRILVTEPSLNAVNKDLHWMFSVHCYVFGILFALLSLYTFLSIINLRSLISTRPFMITINIFLCLLGIFRCSCLCIDAYYLKQTLPKVMASILWDIGFPFLTSAFCLIRLAFLQLTQLKFGPEPIQKESCLTSVMIAHFFFIIVSDIALAFRNHYITKYVVQSIFLVWSMFLYTTFIPVDIKVRQLLRNMPNSMLTYDSTSANQKGIMQLTILAPHNNLATSVATLLMPTLISPKLTEIAKEKTVESSNNAILKDKLSKISEDRKNSEDNVVITKSKANKIPSEQESRANSTVPEVHVRPPTPTPMAANLPIIKVTSTSRRNSLASRRGSDDPSVISSRRSSDSSMRFNIEDGVDGSGRSPELSGRPSPVKDVHNVPEVSVISRRHSENITPSGSTKDLRRCSDLTHEKRGSQFASRLRRNSDYGNRLPKRMMPSEDQRLPKVLDMSPTGSRRNSDIIGLPTKPESRRNSDITYRRNSELSQMKPLISRRISDVSIINLDRSPTHCPPTVVTEKEIPERSESDSDHPDYSEKAALMTENLSDKKDDPKSRKKSLSWNTDKNKEDDITTETSLLTETNLPGNQDINSYLTLHSILNHIAYANHAKSNTPLQISEANTAAIRKSQIRRVLNVTCAAAVLGIILCIADIVRLYGPYGLLADTIEYGTKPSCAQLPKPWPWFLYQTFCRTLELSMSCAMANIIKQPSASPRHLYVNTYHN